MSTLGILVLVFFGLGLAVLFLIVFLFRAVFSPQNKTIMEDEIRLVQDMHRTLSRLEERITVLETILNERQRQQQ